MPHVPLDRHALGRLGEELTAAWYAGCGFTVLARRWRWQGGELDLVVRRGDLLAGVEVKTRRRGCAEPPAAAVDGRKRRRLRLALGQYLHRERPAGVRQIRLDVAQVVVAPDGTGCRLDLLAGIP